MSNSPSINQVVYFTAYLPDERHIFYLCKGTVARLPNREHPTFKVRVEAVSDRAVGGKPIIKQAALLGCSIAKLETELYPEIPVWVKGILWIDQKP